VTDRWLHRRRLVYTVVAFSLGMIAFGAFVFRSEMVASELVRNGTIILTAILSGYVFAATYDDTHPRKGDDAGTDFPGPEDFH